MSASYLPRVGDLPRIELMARAERAISEYGGTKKAEVNFKFTCSHCGARCTLSTPNVLYERGECAECGKETEITMGGFTIHLKL